MKKVKQFFTAIIAVSITFFAFLKSRCRHIPLSIFLSGSDYRCSKLYLLFDNHAIHYDYL